MTANPDLLFLVGCARSGTTWLQLLLAQHPQVATLQETHLFPEYLSPVLDRWRTNSARKRKVGLDVLLEEAEFLDLCRDFGWGALRLAMKEKPGARMILEKTPTHVSYSEDILELWPDAHFIHLIRDPRAVVSSLIDVSRTWGGNWAPSRAEIGAAQWRDAVSEGRRIGARTDRFTEVRYEALFQNPTEELSRVFERLDLPVEPSFCEAAVERCSAGNLKAGAKATWAPSSMQGTLDGVARKAQKDGWRSELTGSQVAAIEYVASDLMSELGYQPKGHRRRLPPVALALRETARGARGLVGRAARRLFGES